jgi:hypothetical protein
MSAQFLVVRQPGAEVPGVGFVKAGQFFTAPPEYVPSRHMRAMNSEAVEELRKLKGQLEKYDAERVEMLKDRKDPDGRPVKAPVLAAEVNLEIFKTEEKPPVVEDAGLSLGQLAELSGGKQVKGGGKGGGGKRLADR